MPYDVITFGEAMIRLSPPNFRRLEQANTLDVLVGGAELNTAVGLARLGHPTAWVSRLTKNPLGRLIANRAREAGVSTDHVLWTDDDRVGVYFLEFHRRPRRQHLWYAHLRGRDCRSPRRRRLLRGRADSRPPGERRAKGRRFRRGGQRHQAHHPRRLRLDHAGGSRSAVAE